MESELTTGHRPPATSWIEISRSALESNLRVFRNLVQPATQLMVVVKANAYGHGIEAVSPIVEAHADWLGVNSLDEALALHRTGVKKPICILGFTPAERAAAVVGPGFRQVVYRTDSVEALAGAAAAAGTTAHVHLKIETGTNRQGILPGDLGRFAHVLREFASIDVEGVSTHFANIEDTLDPSFAEVQRIRFEEALRLLADCGFEPRHIHTAATAGTILYPDRHFTMVRVGIGAYGLWPSRETTMAARERGRRIALKPVLSWKTQIAQIKTVQPGEYVGYGLTFQASRPMRLAVLPVGYYEGYDRRLSNAGRVLVRGKYAPVVGRVAMNMTMVDITDTEADLNDEVVVLGRQGESEIRAEELAERAGTIAYEIVCRIHPAIPRMLV